MAATAQDALEAARLAADATAGKAALGATLTGAGAAIYGGYTLNEWAMALGALAAVGGLVFHAYTTIDSALLRRRKERREEEWHKTRMAALRTNKTGPDTDHMGIFCDTRESQQ
jgi:hypothetical protein